MKVAKKKVVKKIAAATLLLVLCTGHASAQEKKGISDDVVKIGVLGDFSGVFAGMSGPGAVEAVKMAVEDFGGTVLGKKIEIVSADHLNKPDIAATTARTWFDVNKVDMITDLAGSSSALAVIEVARQKNKIAIVNSSASSDIAGARCTPNSIQYTIDTNAIAKGTATAMMKRGLDSWFFVTADYAFGKALERDVSEVVTKNGGKITGSIRHPLGATDFSSFMVQAQSSKAKAIALANTSDDAVNAMKTAREFGIGLDGKQSLVGLLIFIDVVHSLGLQTAQNLTFVTPYYWDADENSRKFAKRFYQRMGRMPSMTHAGNYSSTLHYLNAVKAANTDDAETVMRKMRETPTKDLFSQSGTIRKDGLHVHDMMLVQVKKPAESKGPWDYYKVIQRISASDSYLPISESTCPLVKVKG